MLIMSSLLPDPLYHLTHYGLCMYMHRSTLVYIWRILLCALGGSLAHSRRMEAFLTSFAMPRRTLVLCLLVSASRIVGAHAFERLGGMAPCLLCLDQREAHWTALGVVIFELLVGYSPFFAEST